MGRTYGEPNETKKNTHPECVAALPVSSSMVKAAPNAGYFFPGDPASLPVGNGIPLDYADWTAGPPYNAHHPYDSSRWNL